MATARVLVSLAVCGWLTLGIAAPQVTADGPSIRPGDPAPRLEFKDIRYLTRSLDDLPNKKAHVLVFTSTNCPLVGRYMPVLKRLDEEYREKGVQFVAVNVGADDSIQAMAEQAIRHEVAFPFVKDFDAKCARALGVTRTPEVALLDERRVLRYRGRIDDQYRLSGTQPVPDREELRLAIEALLAGGDVPMRETAVDGCLITRNELKPPAEVITYAEHVAPIVRKHCVSCHRPGTAAPFAFTSYQAVAARADMIAEVVAEQRMPPWYGSASHGEFVNRRSLSADERATIMHWAKSDKARGDETTLPPLELPEPDDKWQISEPDLIVAEQKEHELPAEGVIPYQYVILPYVFPRETWLRGVQILPDNPAVVHHCNMAYMTPTEGVRASNFITGVVPGGEPLTTEEGTAARIPQGASLILQIHFVTTGKPEKCKISVGFKYAEGLVQKQLRHIRLDNSKFAIPPGAAAHPVSDSRTLDRDALGVGLFSHMHLRGKDMTFIAHKPDGARETLLVIPNYSFDWQHAYRWAPNTKRIPKGTKIECLAHYDNSAFNPYNPDPTATVKEGPQTFHEMMNGFFFYTDADEQLGLEIDPTTGGARASGEVQPRDNVRSGSANE
jgi:peroxiredoxin